MLDGVEADGAHPERGLHRHVQVGEIERLQQPQDLHVLAAAGLEQPRLHQPAQGLELGGQLPAGQRGRLIEGADLLLQQRQVMDRIEDHVLAAVAPGMAGNDLAAAADDHPVDVAPDPDVAVAVGDGHRVVVGLVAHQRLGTHPAGRLVAGLERRCRQRRHRLEIALEPLADRLVVTAQDLHLPLAALLLQPGVEVVPGRKPRQRHHEVPSRPADDPLDAALVIALAGSAVAILDDVVRQQPAEERRPLACPVRQDARHQAAVVVVEHRQRHAAEEREGMDMAVGPRLGRRRRVGPDVTGVAVRQVEGEEVRLLLDPADHHRAFLAEVRLGVAGRMMQRHEHLAAAPLMLAQIRLHDRVAAGEPVLIP